MLKVIICSLFPTLHVNLNNQAKNLQIGTIFPSVLTTTTKKYDKSENEKKISSQQLISEKPSSEAICNYEVNKETIAIVDDCKSKPNKLSAVNTETSTDTDINTSTTTEEQEVTTEEVFYRLSDLSPPVIASLLG
ncbi:unnamed protein product [Euphydryas editha]|uniref:Uncharacterized protein n=1 Tax=Euphydryas editha TaxID=104508 RepID=A0AAU9V831_EUPED|nr:unnamed protein product [Euphydryas editha]